ncbi:SDR family oxidoreductase [Nocardia sp. NBC_01499]|uniref:SDR family oxidoreductase n=1 Tax=Nocardia sp. NBC_01499 TaxID=2903597 RepID=UPI003866AD2D
MILLTGADGYLGSRLTAALLATTQHRLILTVRAADRTEFAAKRAAVTAAANDSDRVTVVPLNLLDAEPFSDIDPAPVTAIVHTAALTRFTVDRDDAAAVNVAGTAKVGEFARRCPALERLVVLSTLYAVGKAVGTVHEDPGEDRGFVNHYEWSKWAGEQALLSPGMPTTVIARMPTVIADDATGTVNQYNAFHTTLRLYYYGLLSLLPGDPATPVTVSTTDFAVSALLALLEPTTAGGIYHVCPAPEDTLPLGELVTIAFDAFGDDEAFRRRRLLPPLVCDAATFRTVLEAAAGTGGPLRSALDSISPFADQLYYTKHFDNRRLRAVWPDYRPPNPVALVEAVCQELVATRWGRRQRRSNVPAHA